METHLSSLKHTAVGQEIFRSRKKWSGAPSGVKIVFHTCIFSPIMAMLRWFFMKAALPCYEAQTDV